MRPGERQVSESLDGIRADHTARYRFAASKLQGKSVLDIGCGIGYGSKILADAGFKVKANDIDAEAIEYANEHYAHDNVDFVNASSDSIGPFVGMDAAVCFEMIEHVEDPLPMLKRIAKSAETLIASVPNELVFPYHEGILYHFRHYTPEQFEALLNEAGYEVQEWHGQAGPESPVEPHLQGRTLIAVCQRKENINTGTWKQLPEVRKVPESVAIVAMGKSAFTYVQLASVNGGRQRLADEVWAINSMGNVIKHDLLFHMDDCKVQESRAANNPNIAGMLDWLKEHPRFFTSKVYPEYSGAMAFPLEQVINAIGTNYLNNTVAYAVAYAMFIGVKKISLWGCDYSYSDSHKAESGRGCVEFLLGMAAARGIRIEVAEDTTLLDANVDPRNKPYGYDAYDVEFEQSEYGMKVILNDRDELPTPQEIEQRYRTEKAA